MCLVPSRLRVAASYAAAVIYSCRRDLPTTTAAPPRSHTQQAERSHPLVSLRYSAMSTRVILLRWRRASCVRDWTHMYLPPELAQDTYLHREPFGATLFENMLDGHTVAHHLPVPITPCHLAMYIKHDAHPRALSRLAVRILATAPVTSHSKGCRIQLKAEINAHWQF